MNTLLGLPTYGWLYDDHKRQEYLIEALRITNAEQQEAIDRLTAYVCCGEPRTASDVCACCAVESGELARDTSSEQEVTP